MAGGQIQDVGCPALVKGPYPTAAQAQGNGSQEDMFRGRGRILEAVELAAPVAVTGGRLLGIRTDDDNHRGLGHEILPIGCSRQALSYSGIAHHVKVPRLAVARRWRTNGCL
jgi:hypothetical protein